MEFLFQSPTSTAALLGLGFIIGLKHAVEADHLAAVSTMVAERRSLWSSMLVGGLWGLGHTISLFVAGIFVLLLDFQISETTERWLEFAVGVMLVLLGLNVLRKIVSGSLHFHAHEHGEHGHAHPHSHDHDHDLHHHAEPGSPRGYSPRALVIGLIHGLAGSAGLMLLLLPTIDSKVVGLLYIVVFGVGSIGGMMLMSLLVGLPFHFTALRFSRFNQALQIVAGLASVALGFFIIYEKGISEGLLA